SAGWRAGSIRNRRRVLFHRHAKLEKRAIIFRKLVRDSLGNWLRAFKLRRRIEMHALLARMHRRVAARAFAVLIEPRSENRAATRTGAPHTGAPHTRRPRPEHVLLRTRLLLLRGPVGSFPLLFAGLRVTITPLPILPLHEDPPGGMFDNTPKSVAQ